MNIAIITIGNRDIALKGKDLPYNTNECRKNGEYIIKNFKQLKDKVEIPIIAPFLNSLKDRDIEIDEFLLIATDQNDERYKQSDSILYAKVVKRYLERKNNKSNIISLKENVNDFIFNYLQFQKKMQFIAHKNMKNIYILPVGGMPNINTPLILASILIFREKVRQYYVDKVQKNCYPVPFNQKLIEELEKEKIKNALNKYLYASIAGFSSNEFVKMIAEYAYNRLSFNLIKAKNIADDLIEVFPDRSLKFLGESLNELKNSLDYKINEILLSVIIKINQEQYADALLRLFNFTDNLLTKEICRCYDFEFDIKDDHNRWWNKAVKKIRKENPNIQNELKKIDPQRNDLNKPGIPIYCNLIKLKNKDSKIFEIILPLLKVSNLRNKSIAAHGFGGVSLDSINQVLIENNLVLETLIEKIEDFIDTSFSDSIYITINSLIKNELNIKE